MRIATVLTQVATFVGVSSAISTSAYLWVVDSQNPQSASNQVSTTSSDTARAILARRRGFSDSSYITTTDETTLSDINEFGGYQQPLFAASSQKHPSKLFIRIDNFDGSVSEFNSLPNLWIEQPRRDLLNGFRARANIEDVCEYDLAVPMKEDVKVVYSYATDGSTCMSKQEVELLPTILALYSSVPTSKNVGGKGMTSFSRMLRHFQATSNIESTVLILPSELQLAKVPNNQASKRSNAQKKEEEPLDLPSGSSSSSLSKVDTTFAGSDSSLPSLIPQCFASNDSCTNTTNSCSGHGSCYKAHNNCFKCRCGTTVVRKNSDGTQKTVQWGGNACQKKDVSTPFILFAGFGVAFTALVAGGIGMLYTMGSQDLPSVIGAGVVGPRAQK